MTKHYTHKLPLLPLLNEIIGLLDPYGTDHPLRVRDMVLTMAGRFGLDTAGEEFEEIGLAAVLHDVGKLGVPEYIRRNPGKYLTLERMMMEQHTIIGYNLLVKVENGLITHRVCLIVKYHHENWDGSGYPDKLIGDVIPLGSRMIRICDFYDAITNVRGYQPAMSSQQAVSYMVKKQSERVWADPQLFTIFLQMMKEKNDEEV